MENLYIFWMLPLREPDFLECVRDNSPLARLYTVNPFPPLSCSLSLAVEIPNLHKFEQGKCGTLVENQSVILKVVGSNPSTIYFEESELCVL